MKAILLKPTREPHAHHTLTGDAYADYEVMELPYTPIMFEGGSQAVLTVWKASFWDRLKFLFDGRVSLTVLGRSQPAMSVHLGDFLYEQNYTKN